MLSQHTQAFAQTIAVVTVLLCGCSREPTPIPVGQPSVPVKTAAQLELEAAPKNSESESEANIRNLIRVDGFPCDQVTQMKENEQGGSVTCLVAGATKLYRIDGNGKVFPE